MERFHATIDFAAHCKPVAQVRCQCGWEGPEFGVVKISGRLLCVGCAKAVRQPEPLRGVAKTLKGGGKAANVKLNMELARIIRARAAVGDQISDMAREYGVTPQCIWNVVHGKTWVVKG